MKMKNEEERRYVVSKKGQSAGSIFIINISRKW